MLVQNYWSDIRRNRSENASLRPVFCAHRPIVKVKYRSFVPTASSLLVSRLEHDQLCEIADIHSMERQLRVHEIPERPNVIDSLIPRYKVRGKASCSCITSHRSEDIYVRQDEEGIRTHFCPLDRTENSDKEDDEDDPDVPMKLGFDFDLMLGLKSEEIPYLMAEKPPLTDSEEIPSSDVDSSTAMIYAPMSNIPSVKEDSDSLLYFPKHRVKKIKGRKLDEKIMAAWTDDSSDENEYYVDGERELFQKKVYLEDESDMEEFEETHEKTNVEYEKLDSSQNEEETTNTKNITEQDENESTHETGNTEHLKKTRNSYESKNRPKNERKALPAFKNTDEKKLKKEEEASDQEKSKDPKVKDESNPLDNHKQTESLNADILTPFTSIKVTDKDKYMKDHKLYDSVEDIMKKLLCMETYDNLTRDACSGEDSNTSTESKAVVQEQDRHLFRESLGKNSTNQGKETNLEMTEIDVAQKTETNYFEVPVGHPMLPQIFIEAEMDPKEGNLSMEPPATLIKKESKKEETEPDLPTKLRFMTEVYHTRGNEDLYSDTLSNLDIPSEAEKSKGTIVFDSYERNEPSDKQTSINIKSPSTSNIFESALPEERRTVTRQRNIFSKFLRSFKRRLVKKA